MGALSAASGLLNWFGLNGGPLGVMAITRRAFSKMATR